MEAGLNSAAADAVKNQLLKPFVYIILNRAQNEYRIAGYFFQLQRFAFGTFIFFVFGRIEMLKSRFQIIL
ncbi:MAG: hypothetical protein Tsb0015_08140 [Simkaniaceae bacterium]